MSCCTLTKEIAMLKIVVAGVTALFVTASPLAYAQAPAERAMERLSALEHLSAADRAKVTDERIDLVKAALQLTPDQEKYWPAIEQAIRARAKDRQARLAEIATEFGDRSPIEIIRDRNPVEFMQRRAEAYTHRATDLKKLSDAWEPLYKTLTPEQKKRMAFLTLVVGHEIGDAIEQRHLDAMDDDAAF